MILGICPRSRNIRPNRQKSVSNFQESRPNFERLTLLFLLNISQLVAYIGLLAMLGQGLLFILAGQKRQTNLFYQLFQVLNKPWFALARWLSPAKVAVQHHGYVGFFVLAVLYLAITVAKIEHCIGVGMVGCR